MVIIRLAVRVSRIDLSREVDPWVRSDTFLVGVHPGSEYMPSIVLVHQRGSLMVAGRDVLKQRKLKDEGQYIHHKHSMADHRLILHPFFHLATEDCVARSFQRLLMIDLIKDTHDSLVVHLRWLEDCMDDRSVRKHNIVDERLLEATLRRTNGLRAGTEYSP